MAPEVATARYTQSADIWSVGVILHILLTGSPPFVVKEIEDLFDIRNRGIAHLFKKRGNTVSEEAKDLVRRLLHIDPQKRITAHDALSHTWFRSVSRPPKGKISISTKICRSEEGSPDTVCEREFTDATATANAALGFLCCGTCIIN